jgi:hypothetical protein
MEIEALKQKNDTLMAVLQDMNQSGGTTGVYSFLLSISWPTIIAYFQSVFSKNNVTYMVFYPPVLLGGMIKSYVTL